ncbi:S-adenosylmethionine:tRNA ribosyltransferase-isomerase [Skermania sp. ID1734]|uniref:S-adenosylmethionine:tRNA ribosyltransferase-isomerase n=1 Tax=Skermania sp. ID1734 TaxID=2597516 RepID=UPI0011809AE2|nr:S-adenosylmethionine:tRNA ribosyltransferase-isomerase [Skermania sp. ID1734]TSE01011.1 S-adenosylmethionine:tRNA ribosyltransferase-isomerase [Skermania sp. ID1734]
MMDFALPPELQAAGPPESRGLARDEVRLLVSDTAGLTHAVFRELPTFLRPDDIVVVNNSATLSAAVDARLGEAAVVVHFSTWLDDGSWVIEVRTTDGRPVPWHILDIGTELRLSGGATAVLRQPWLPPARRLWTADIDVAIPAYLARHGRPITYAYLRQRWSAQYYQTAFGTVAGSAEMPSAGRPFTAELVARLVSTGIAVTPITLHCGVSSPETGEPPSPERFAVSQQTADRVNATRAAGGRVIAIGTTVTRALESATGSDGIVHAASGWTDVVLGPQRPAHVVDGLVTGWHAPGASHLDLLEAVAGAEVVRDAYAAALDAGYLWHEFGDSALLVRY